MKIYRYFQVTLLIVLTFIGIIVSDDFSNYVLGVGDQIIVCIYDSNGAEISEFYRQNVMDKPADREGTQYKVPYDGILDIVGFGKVQVSGKTIGKLTKELTRQAKVYDNNPRVEINLIEIRKISVYVMGAVKLPGVKDVYVDGYYNTLINLLTQAGGYDGNSDITQIYIEHDNKKEVVSLDVSKRSQYIVKENSYIYVPYIKDFVIVIGEVIWPGTKAYNPNFSLQDYLALAGGFRDSAAEEIYVVNDLQKQDEENKSRLNSKVTIEKNLHIKNVDGEVVIKTGTIIFVPKNIFASWGLVFSNLILIRDTLNYPRTFNEATSYYIQK